jgi:hypothetical protein
MIGSISTTPTSISFQQYSAAQSAPPPSKAAPAVEDTVQLSDQTQQTLNSQQSSAKKETAPPSQPSISQLVKEAADGDLSALARLAVVG